ncbi:uncharacterized protein LOC115627296 [Scaptodrosophila lebanonensis]|uniref:Uncharacterized protein LOC115627296 n=1 Tax=Drosophila lebanonensis TaxID=7225 RepID=A0A6J2TRW1_DROLE|nr:uncharacterized protein LOC115627296 [Scaptodrosophila lebanonensis]
MSQLAATSSYKPPDLTYTPGDLTEPKYRLPSHQLLLDEKRDRDNGVERELPLNRLYLGDHECPAPNKYRSAAEAAREVNSAAGRQFPALAAAQARYAGHLDTSSDIVDLAPLPSTVGFGTGKELTSVVPTLPPVVTVPDYSADPDLIKKMPLHSITEKPNERCPSPVVPAYANFELAKRMHQDNLDHQPLPDCVADLAFRKAQISGGHGGLALDIDPIATGVGVKTHNAGPTHCTKLRVYRPKTGGGVVPKAYVGDTFRGIGSAPTKKMGPMDLAICWDYKPANPTDEPRPSRHIDGSNESAGPAVFTCVKTPREENMGDLGRSAGIFTNTLGEADFFDKDILRRKTDFGGRHIERENNCACDYGPPPPRARSVSRDSSASHCRRGIGSGGGGGGGGVGVGGCGMPNRLAKQYQSSPMLTDKTYQALREKYLGPDTGTGGCDGGALLDHGCRPAGPACKRDALSLLRRPTRRLCHKVAPAPAQKCCQTSPFSHCMTSKAAFRVGVPKHNAVGDFVGANDACGASGSRVLVVPRPRNPYSKKNYDIDTLVPPFRSQGGGAGQGGYPEHWRLASVYQHAYKPMEQRRRPLLQTVYK